MSKPCKDCRKSIFNTQKSNIPAPECQDCDDFDVDCDGEVTYSDCVTVTTDLSCSLVESGSTLTEALVLLDNKICDTASGACTAMVDATDTCCGFLIDKFVSGTLDITKSGSTCKQVRIEERCWEWNTVKKVSGTDGVFKLKWNTLSNLGADTQPVQYSEVKECIVRLRGTAVNGSYNAVTDNTIFVLPFGYRPLKERIFSVNVQTGAVLGNPYYVLPGLIFVKITGEVVLLYSNISPSSTTSIVSLDSISFELD